MKRFVMGAGVFLILFVYSYVQGGVVQAAGVPQLINYQGYLTDKDGNPLTTGEYTLSFSIYNVPSGGTAVWGPETFNNVPVVKGYFNVILGGKLPISNAFTSDKTYLSISVNNGSPITPRQQILSAPYTMEAQHAATATNADNGRNILTLVPPIGSIIAWHKNMPGTPGLPDGWVECNGQPINDPAAPWYNGQPTPNLNYYVSSNTDGRYGGRFLRGSPVSGNWQDDYLAQHTHTYTTWNTPLDMAAGGYGVARSPYPTESSGVNGTEVGLETFPCNMSVVWIMRIK